MATATIHAFVSGRVQGVFYRGSLAKQATRLQLTGFVRNLPDGRVEYVAMGDEQAVDKLKRWSLVGPVAADVMAVEVVEYLDGESFPDFSVRY